ncbi:2'-5' RNA ligase family protein [Streptomyces sp. SID5785]|uniref:2'-5' RNA ligase family protein n=1 Tax=Streptomyces sp. SID5785 TaxID=2690309 RepID=UPI001360FDBF|nr:2'-5' RNA ligase family protein [Streptomyces sp. SID5785]MZD03848.1 2'-5' RNA ligase family protein [Streptomyces sp. SID5785]
MTDEDAGARRADRADGADRDDEGWPDAAGDTALSVPVPEAAALVRTGSEPHLTLLYPFLPLPRITPADGAALAELFAATRPFTLAFPALRRWPGVLYLAPQPDEPLRALTKALRERWPGVVPYRGVFGHEGLDPHLTLAAGPGTDELPAPRFAAALPLRTRVDTVRLVVTDGPGTGWRPARSFRLGGARPRGLCQPGPPPVGRAR